MDAKTPSVELVRYDAMCRAIDAAYEVDEVKGIRDKAMALETYSRLANNTENERRACEIRLRAERKAGQLLAETEKAKGSLRRGNTVSPRGNEQTETLADRGVSKKQSSDWQKLADVPQEQFDAALADPTTKSTTAGIIRANAEPKSNPVSNDALWLWGRLLDFERNGMLRKDPAEVLESMTPEMLNDVHVYAPRVVAWLRKIGAVDDKGRDTKTS